MKTNTPLQVVVQFPQTEAGRQELARRVAQIHADFVVASIRRLSCPPLQKKALLQSVLDTVRGRHPVSGQNGPS